MMELYRAVFECAPDAVLVVGQDGRITRVNSQAERLFGYDQSSLNGRMVETLIPSRFASEHASHRSRYASESRPRPMGVGLDLLARRSDGTEFPVDVMLSPVQTDSGACVIAVVRDVTDRKRLELEQQRIVTLADEGVEFIGMYDRAFQPFYVNAAGMQLVGLDDLEAACRVRVQEYFFPEDHDFITNEFFPRVMREGRGEVEIRFRHFKTGRPIWMLYAVRNLKDPSGAVVGWTTVSRNIDDRRRAEDARDESEARLRLAQQAARIGSFEWNIQTGVNIWTPELEVMYGLQPGEFERTQSSWESLVYADDRESAKNLVLQAMQTGLPVEGEWRVVWRDGTTHWIFGRFQAFRDASGRPLRVAGVNFDITERRQAEEELRRTRDELEVRVRERTAELLDVVREKDVLLKEIHHRVKNNLAVVSSLLYLQAAESHDTHVVKSLEESRDRVRAMSLIHETLHQSANLAEVDFAEYARTLTTHLLATYRVAKTKIRLEGDFQHVAMKLETAIPCGLILNELISNVLKHAYPRGRSGHVKVTVARDDSGSIALTVRDDGVGLPVGIDVANPTTLGLRLIHTLAGQLDAEVAVRTVAPGTEATLRVHPDRVEVRAAS